MSAEWKGLPRPERIDLVTGEWFMSMEERAALDDLRMGELCGRHRLDRFARYIFRATGFPQYRTLRLVTEYPTKNS